MQKLHFKISSDKMFFYIYNYIQVNVPLISAWEEFCHWKKVTIADHKYGTEGHVCVYLR